MTDFLAYTCATMPEPFRHRRRRFVTLSDSLWDALDKLEKHDAKAEGRRVSVSARLDAMIRRELKRCKVKLPPSSLD